MLQGGAAKTRGTKQRAMRSPLAGRLFDETGDRLTPSHSRKNGKRLRYYISRRLVVDRTHKHPDAWMLPADQLEGLLSEAARRPDIRLVVATRVFADLGRSAQTIFRSLSYSTSPVLFTITRT
jgi:site-specific DNA recombinase